MHAAESIDKEDSAHPPEEYRGEVGVLVLRGYRFSIAINKFVERLNCFHTCFGASEPVACVSRALMANPFIAMLANAGRRYRSMIETVHASELVN